MAPTEDLNPAHVCGASWRLREYMEGEKRIRHWIEYFSETHGIKPDMENKTGLDSDVMQLTFILFSMQAGNKI